ncbi:MAG: hypothetical protein ACI97K_001944 [Glaciecola sp.]|jgi:hypothetical protein
MFINADKLYLRRFLFHHASYCIFLNSIVVNQKYTFNITYSLINILTVFNLIIFIILMLFLATVVN